MKNFIDNLKLAQPSQIPSKILDQFAETFPDAYNCEWSMHDTIYEVIFYNAEQECIAGFSENANQIFLKRNLKLANTPEDVREAIGSEWELMNILEITQNQTICHECIVRDKELVRYAFYFDSNAKITKKEIL
jgi:hypothetical protein